MRSPVYWASRSSRSNDRALNGTNGLDIAPSGNGLDVLALDPSLEWLYVAAESGDLEVFDIGKPGLVSIDGEASHSVAVNPATHRGFFPLVVGENGTPVLRIVRPAGTQYFETFRRHEPFGALDARVREELRSWLRRLHDEARMTTLLVTHDQEEAMDLADRIMVMNRGAVEQEGTPGEIYDSPTTPFVASFIGSSSRLEGRIAGGRTELEGHDLGWPQAVGAAGEDAKIDAFVRTTRLGWQVKIELQLPSSRTLTVQYGKEQADAIGVRPGDRVLLTLRGAKVFAQRTPALPSSAPPALAALA